MLEQAKAAAEKGDFDTAEELANKARSQGEAAYEQATEQESRWSDFVVR